MHLLIVSKVSDVYYLAKTYTPNHLINSFATQLGSRGPLVNSIFLMFFKYRLWATIFEPKMSFHFHIHF